MYIYNRQFHPSVPRCRVLLPSWHYGFPAGFGETTVNLNSLASASTKPTVENALKIIKIIGEQIAVPWRVGYTILAHEGGISLFRHKDGVMQTIEGARQSHIPRIPRTLKLALLELAADDQTSDAQLTQRLHNEFQQRLAIQIATGMQELKSALTKFNGYVALAFAGYNAGGGSVSRLVTKGKHNTRPRTVTDAEWEKMCLAAATMLHQPPGNARVEQGIWLCDPNLRSKKKNWIPRYGSRMYDKKSGLRLVGFQYLRRVKGFVPSQGPTTVCDFSVAKKDRVQAGSGDLKYKTTRLGALDKLYNPQNLGKAYYEPAKDQMPAITDDNLPLKVSNGKLTKVKTDGSIVDVPI